MGQYKVPQKGELRERLPLKSKEKWNSCRLGSCCGPQGALGASDLLPRIILSGTEKPLRRWFLSFLHFYIVSPDPRHCIFAILEKDPVFQVWYRSIKFTGHLGSNMNQSNEFLGGKWCGLATGITSPRTCTILRPQDLMVHGASMCVCEFVGWVWRKMGRTDCMGWILKEYDEELQIFQSTPKFVD